MDQAKVVKPRGCRRGAPTGTPIKELPQEVRPVVAADSNAIASELQKCSEKRSPVGRSRSSTSRAKFRFNVSCSPPGLSQARRKFCVADAVALHRAGDHVQAAGRPAATCKLYRPEEVAELVEACPSMEVVDTRFDTKYRTIRQRLNERATMVEAYADHITNGGFIVGKGLKIGAISTSPPCGCE